MIADLFRELMQATAASTAAVLVIAVLRKPLRKLIGAEAAYRVWLLVPAAVLAVWLPAPTLAPVAAKTMTGSVVGAISVTGAAQAWSFDWVAPALLVWLLGVVFSALYFAVRQRRFNQRILRRPEQPFDMVEGAGPAVVGGWRTRIVLPMDFRDRYSDDEQRLILAHEFQHVCRGDLRAQTVATLLRGLFWFNPLIHVGASLFRFDQELACDAAVLKQFPQERRRYADAMLKTQLAQFGLPLACYWQSSHSIKERISMLKQPLPSGARRIAGGLLTLALMSAGAFSAWAAQPGAAASGAVVPGSDDMALVTRLTDKDHVTAPEYPAKAKAAGVTGKVWLGLLVDVEGHVKDVHVISAEPAGVFEQAAMDAARQWSLHPDDAADGKSYERWVKLLVKFTPDKDAKATAGSPDGKIAPAPAAAMPSAPTLTMSPAPEGLATRVGDISVKSVPVPGMADQPRPEYPKDALAKRIGGDVVLHVQVHADGTVGEVKVVQSTPAGVFDSAAVAAVRRWSFASNEKDGGGADHWMRVPISFRPD